MPDTPPQLTNLKLSTNTVDLSNGPVNLTFTATAQDDVGVVDLEMDFGFANGSSFLGGTTSIFHSPSWPNGQFSSSEAVDVSTHDGPYVITGAVLIDTFGHQVNYTTAQLQALGVNTTITVSHADTTGPTLQALTLPSTVSPGGPLTISASATDPHGVQKVVIEFDKNLTAGGGVFDLFGLDDSWADGASAHTETLPLNTAGGVYTIKDIQLFDNLNNVTTLSTAQLAAAGFHTTVTVNPGDTTPPALSSLTFPATVNVSGGSKAITFAATGTDNATGVADVRVHFDKDLTTGAATGGLVDISGNTDSWADGSSSIAQTIPTSAKPGVYTVTSVDVFDGAGNQSTYTNAQLQAAHFSTTLTISSNSQDTTPPNLLTLTFPTSVDLSNGEKFMDWFATAQDGSGIGSLTVWFDHDIGFDFGSIALYPGFILDGTTGDSWADGASSGRLTLPTSDAFDVVMIDHIDLYDTLGNLHTYTTGDLPGLGIQSGFVLFNNQINVLPVDVIPGTQFNDNLHGNADNNFIWGGPGDDTLTCGGGSDFLDGGPGNDTYFIISSSDTIIESNSDVGFDSAFVSVNYVLQINVSIELLATIDATSTVTINLTGNEFDQTIQGNAGANRLDGRGGNDILIGGDGDDVLIGGAGADTLSGGIGFDYASYETATIGVTAWLANSAVNTGDAAGDVYFVEGLIGSNFADTLIGDAGGNVLQGLDGNDRLDGQAGVDLLLGGNGDDVLIGGAGADTLNGGAGFDYASYETATIGVTAWLANSAVNTGDAVGDVYFVEGLIGSNFADTLLGDAGGNVLQGLDGNDRLDGQAGVDLLLGGNGDDVLIGGAGADTLNGGAGFDYASYETATIGVTAWLANSAVNTGDAAGDVYLVEGLIGSNFADTLMGDSGGNVLKGLDGNDKLDGQGSNDLLLGGNGDDVLIGGAGADTLNGGAGFDYASYETATAGVTAWLANSAVNTGDAAGDIYFVEGLIGSNFDDILIGDSLGNVLQGGDGNDKLDGQGGNDLLLGGNGDDVLIGGTGADNLTGGAGFDYASYETATAGVTAWLANSAVNTGDASGDIYFVEGLIGSSFNDTLMGDSFGNVLQGLDGNDKLDGQGGNDLLLGGNGDDILIGGAGADNLTGGTGFDYASYETATFAVTANLANSAANTGDAAGDIYFVEGLIGSNFNDTLIGDSADNILVGGLGADMLNGGAGFDYASYFTSAAGVTANLANSAVNTGDAVGDIYFVEGLIGSNFNDSLIGDSFGNVLQGLDGNDRIDGGTGNDLLIGGNGVDTFVFRNTYGSDRVADFNTAQDMIELQTSLAGSFSQAMSLASQVGADVQFHFASGDVLTLSNVQIANLTIGNFLFTA
jgi:Ca2+-binding RTX toxin-like protein